MRARHLMVALLAMGCDAGEVAIDDSDAPAGDSGSLDTSGDSDSSGAVDTAGDSDTAGDRDTGLQDSDTGWIDTDVAAGVELSGRVVDAQSNAAVAGATLRIHQGPGGVLATSDAQGDFVAQIPVGEWFLLIEAADRWTVGIWVDVPAGGPIGGVEIPILSDTTMGLFELPIQNFSFDESKGGVLFFFDTNQAGGGESADIDRAYDGPIGVRGGVIPLPVRRANRTLPDGGESFLMFANVDPNQDATVSVAGVAGTNTCTIDAPGKTQVPVLERVLTTVPVTCR